MVKTAPARRTFNITQQPEAPDSSVISTRRKETKEQAKVRLIYTRWDKLQESINNFTSLFKHPENYGGFSDLEREDIVNGLQELFNGSIEAVTSSRPPRILKLRQHPDDVPSPRKGE